MGSGPEAYVDTSALIAFADRSDRHHPLFVRLFADPPRLVTTVLVLAEGHGWFLRRHGRAAALQFLAMIEVMTPLEVVDTDDRDRAAASRLLRQFGDQDLTLTDAMGLHVARAQAVKSIWSTDFHLGLTGIPLAVTGR